QTTLYGTGLIVEPPYGWYFDVVPRSSIIKTGYLLANSVGVIDRSYRGELMIPLLKIDPKAPEISLPRRIAQLIPRPIVHMPVAEVQQLGATQRGNGGFGSTG
ncbi:MAG: dUTP diphosphatase, partial [Polyangiaceae bacterium]|nr:dUTP diphosphatase [Polyangiaceae bacterium]